MSKLRLVVRQERPKCFCIRWEHLRRTFAIVGVSRFLRSYVLPVCSVVPTKAFLRFVNLAGLPVILRAVALSS